MKTDINWRSFKAMVIGDVMLDRLTFGEVTRHTPDSGVPIILVDRTEHLLGGAANVANNLKALGATDVRLVGMTGVDEDGLILRKLLKDAGIASVLAGDSGRCTTVKQSVIGTIGSRNQHKMFRIDHESTDGVSEQTEGHIINSLLDQMSRFEPEIVLIEDYNKGVCTAGVCRAAIARAREMGIQVLVDPGRGEPLSKYRGCACLTPNRLEARLATNRDSPRGQALAILEMSQCQAAVITLDRDGCFVGSIDDGQQPENMSSWNIPTIARDVADVTGAGDMVLAMLACARVNGMSWSEAAWYANVAAGLECQVFGTKPIPLAEITAEAKSRSTADSPRGSTSASAGHSTRYA